LVTGPNDRLRRPGRSDPPRGRGTRERRGGAGLDADLAGPAGRWVVRRWWRVRAVPDRGG